MDDMPLRELMDSPKVAAAVATVSVGNAAVNWVDAVSTGFTLFAGVCGAILAPILIIEHIKKCRLIDAQRRLSELETEHKTKELSGEDAPRPKRTGGAS